MENTGWEFDLSYRWKISKAKFRFPPTQHISKTLSLTMELKAAKATLRV